MSSLARGSRTYEFHWTADENNFEKFGGLTTISIGIRTQATYITDKAYIWIEYGFANATDGFDNLDDVL